MSSALLDWEGQLARHHAHYHWYDSQAATCVPQNIQLRVWRGQSQPANIHLYGCNSQASTPIPQDIKLRVWQLGAKHASRGELAYAKQGCRTAQATFKVACVGSGCGAWRGALLDFGCSRQHEILTLHLHLVGACS